MYSKKDTRELKTEFWTSFGRFMKPYKSVNRSKINWINYNTGVKNIGFKLQAEQSKINIAVEINHKDVFLRSIFFEQFLALKNFLHSILEEEWIWKSEVFDDYGVASSKISISLEGKNSFSKEDWNDIFTFFQKRLIKLDRFWSDAKETFIDLSN